MSSRDTIAYTKQLHLYRDVIVDEIWLSHHCGEINLSLMLGDDKIKQLLRDFAVQVIKNYESKIKHGKLARFSWDEFFDLGREDSFLDTYRVDELWQ